jgi:hypothetical protein
MTGIEYFARHSRHDKTGRGAYIFAADSFMATVDAAEDVTLRPDGAGGAENRAHAASMRERAVGGDHWTFGTYRTLDGWRAAMLAGDAEGAARVARFGDAVASALVSPVSTRRKIARGPQGDEVCPHAILAGRLDRAWTMRRRAVGRAPAPVAILVPMTSNAGADSESFAWRATAALALAGPMVRAGYRVSIIAADCVQRSFIAPTAPRYLCVFHRIASGVTLDVPRVSAALSAPHLRHCTFAAIVAAPWAITGGLGQAVEDPAQYIGFALSAGIVRAGEEILTIPPSLRDERSARKWLSDTSKRYGKQA